MTKCPRWLASKRLDSRPIQEERRNEDIFLLAFAGEATPPGLSRENSRPPVSGARTALRVRRPNREPIRRQFPPGPMPASRRQCFALPPACPPPPHASCGQFPC